MSIPLKIRASLAVAHGERHAGALPLGGLSRLRETLADAGGALHVELRGGHDAVGRSALIVRAAADLTLTCQRCLAPFAWTLDLDEVLSLAASEEEEARLMQDCEPYRVQDDWLHLHEIVEDEVMLALPMLPRCRSCENALQSSAAAEVKVDRPNPFAQLKNLKLDKR